MPEWMLIVFGSSVAAMIALQSWILLELISIKVTQAKYESSRDDFDKQLARFESDIESEKGTRVRLHSEFERRLRDMEITIGKQFR